jgi:hypothetical protein
MSTSLLKCLYNVNSIPAQAQIAITNDDGRQTVQTSSLNTSGSWVNFGAYNFDFSDLSLLTVKLGGNQSNSAQATPQTNTQGAKISITCVKGKTSKIVTGAKPVCPAGFKAKK